MFLARRARPQIQGDNASPATLRMRAAPLQTPFTKFAKTSYNNKQTLSIA
jgi:hypothetical protein